LQAFYADKPSKILRLGDVVTGFHFAALHMDSPGTEKTLDVKIHVTRPNYFAVMTPCCSIENQSISLAPLTELRHKFFEFPRLVEDFTRLNVPMPPEETLPPKHWENLSTEEKSKLIANGPSYIFLECFIYEPNAIFATYPMKKGTQSWPAVGHRMLDFKRIVRIECTQIERNRDAPAGTKLLELTIAARSQLRDKLAYFFGRIPDEDAA
jgi:hypothetical protein